MVHIFAVIQSISMMASFSLAPIKIISNSNFGTLVLANILKILIGMKAFLQRNLVSFIHLNSRKTQVILLFQVDQVQMK